MIKSMIVGCITAAVLCTSAAATKKEYKNPFTTEQKARDAAQVKMQKFIVDATPKSGTKSKRNPQDSQNVKRMKKKITDLNYKIFKKYLKVVDPIGKKINRYTEEISKLNERIKMTDNADSTMERKTKLETTVEELKQEVRDRCLAFEPVPAQFSKAGDKKKGGADYRKIFKWLVDLGAESTESKD